VFHSFPVTHLNTMNELLWFLMLLLDFGALLLLYRFLGKTGVFIWIPIATILANIQVLKIVQLFGFTSTLGNIAYASLFLATDILSENHSRKDANLAVLVGFLTMLLTIAIMSLALVFKPDGNDFAQPSLKVIFGFLPRVLTASLCAYLVSQFYDVASYHFLKKIKPGTSWLWLRNNLSTLVAQLLDTVIFTTIAFYGVFEWTVFVSIVCTTYILKALTALLDTPGIYLAKTWFQKNKIPD
jgi:uncharacterized integral membrane protein (TIGR00697 family)